MTLSTSWNTLPPDLKLSWSILSISKKPYANDHSVIITAAKIWTKKVRIKEYIVCQSLLGKDHNERNYVHHQLYLQFPINQLTLGRTDINIFRPFIKHNIHDYFAIRWQHRDQRNKECSAHRHWKRIICLQEDHQLLLLNA